MGETRAQGRVTMRDIATKLGVSINTVHKAITGKPGLSNQMREKIVETANQMGYRRNEGAANLSRKDILVAVCLPSSQREGSYFYAYLWEGCRRYVAESRDTGLVFEVDDFESGEYAGVLASIESRIDGGEDIGGLLAFAPTSGEERGALARIADKGVAVLLLDGDCDEVPRVGAVITDYHASGCLMAEQAANLIASVEAPRVLLLSGDEGTDSHRLVAQAFESELAPLAPAAQVERIPGAHGNVERLSSELSRALEVRAASLVCSVSAVGTEVASRVLGELRPTGVRAIGSDLFPGSVKALEQGVLTNLVYKDPVGMAYRAARTLGDFLLWGKRPEQDVQMGPVELVFRSNLAQYCRIAGVKASESHE
ncbi:substrate-binding domain-containing protein [uncultured Parolsenella sp.]|uniref:substrate-binding domain-containing protein n=1 Tax=uncultured Parolsenella sp. TaxID=2083008 RepID=UPI0025ED60F7|nr:substrate-binding domain-containing protein [uncultured Parolsenella sp.]